MRYSGRNSSGPTATLDLGARHLFLPLTFRLSAGPGTICAPLPARGGRTSEYLQKDNIDKCYIYNIMPFTIPDTITPPSPEYSRREGYETGKKWIKIGLIIFIIGIISGIITYLIGMIYFSFLTLGFSPIICFIGILFILAGLVRQHRFA